MSITAVAVRPRQSPVPSCCWTDTCRNYRTEGPFLTWLLNSRPDGLVVFDGGGDAEAELARRARASGVAVRVVDARAVLIGKR